MNMILSTIAFLYSMYLVGKGAALAFTSIAKNGLQVIDLFVLITFFVILNYAFKHWVSDFVDWTKPNDEENR